MTTEPVCSGGDVWRASLLTPTLNWTTSRWGTGGKSPGGTRLARQEPAGWTRGPGPRGTTGNSGSHSTGQLHPMVGRGVGDTVRTLESTPGHNSTRYEPPWRPLPRRPQLRHPPDSPGHRALSSPTDEETEGEGEVTCMKLLASDLSEVLFPSLQGAGMHCVVAEFAGSEKSL